MKASRTLIAAAVAALITGAAVANDPYDSKSSSKAGATFDTLDTNRDGRISRAEAAADANIVFSTADANGDGYLDNMEYKKAQKSKSSDSSMPTERPQSDTMPNDTSTTEPTAPPDQSSAPPADTETPRQ